MVPTRYAPSSFQHNARVAAVLLPSLIVLVGFGGKLAAGVLMAGVMVRYFPSCIDPGVLTILPQSCWSRALMYVTRISSV